jgi:hypothetical protein
MFLNKVRYDYAATLLLLGASTASLAAAAALPPDLAKSVRDYDRAQIQGDRKALSRLLADDYRLVNSKAEVETKSQFIAESTDPTFRLDPFVITKSTETVWRTGAVLSGEVMLTGTSAGQSFKARIRFADTWAHRAGRWQVVFTSVTPVAATTTP